MTDATITSNSDALKEIIDLLIYCELQERGLNDGRNNYTELGRSHEHEEEANMTERIKRGR